MSWRSILERGFCIIGSTMYDMKHLANATYDLCIPSAPGHAEIKTQLHIRYSCHCVSVSTKYQQPLAPGTVEHSFLIFDDRGLARFFCPTRHALSTMLPSIFQSIISRKLFHTAGKNFLLIEYASNGNNKSYLVFFSVTKDTNGLKIYVESAYPDDAGISKRNQRPISARVVLAKKFRGEAIKKTPPR